jgi:AAA domain-containing protein
VRTLGSIARRPQEAGEFLPAVFTPLENAGIRLREGTVTIIAGVAGSMKTGLALYWVGRLNRPTLYFSADSEGFEVFERAAAMVTGDTMTKVRANMPAYEDAVNGLNMRFVFEDSPTYKDVELEVAAYAEVYGEWPHVIVIDNLLNLVGENENEWGAHRDHARVVHRLARVTKAKVIVLAHMGESQKDPSVQPPPRTMLQGKVSHLPKVILSLAFDGQRLKVAPVKNRFGPGDASGSTYVELYCDPASNRFFNSAADRAAGRPA